MRYAIGIIGLGNMGSSIAHALRRNFSKTRIIGYDTDILKARQCQKRYRVILAKNVNQILSTCRVVILCVKPQDLRMLLGDIRKHLPSRRIIFISIAAGVSLNFLEKYLKDKPVVRVMPNLGTKIGKSASVYSLGRNCNANDEKMALSVLKSFGLCIRVKEIDVDKITALSGSGPAYIFYVFESLLEAGRSLGLGREICVKLLYQTFLASLEILKDSDFDTSRLIKSVASKKGTTERALKTFERYALKSIYKQALRQAYLRAKELSRRLGR